MNEFVVIAAIAAVIGFIIGWLIEWWLDLTRWKVRAKQAGVTILEDAGASEIDAESASVFERVLNAKETELKNLRIEHDDLIAKLGRAEAKLEERELQLDRAQDELAKQRARLTSVQTDFNEYMRDHPDDLSAIAGIDQEMWTQLYNGGIHSYAQLAATTPEHLREIAGAGAGTYAELERWIEQAKTMANRAA